MSSSGPEETAKDEKPKKEKSAQTSPRPEGTKKPKEEEPEAEKRPKSKRPDDESGPEGQQKDQDQDKNTAARKDKNDRPERGSGKADRGNRKSD